MTHPTPNTQAEPTTQALIEACDKHAAHYVDDPRQDIVTDVRNAFFAGAKYSTPPAPPAADVAGLVAELGRLLAKITAPEGNYTASDRTEFTMQMLNGINKLAALAQPKQPARVELPPLSDAEYRRGYRDGYNRRDDEVKGALA